MKLPENKMIKLMTPQFRSTKSFSTEVEDTGRYPVWNASHVFTINNQVIKIHKKESVMSLIRMTWLGLSLNLQYGATVAQTLMIS